MFRKKFVISILVILLLLVGFKLLFFNSLAKMLLTKAGEKAFKAKVNISKVDFKFLKGQMSIYGVIVGDKNEPYENLFEFQKASVDIAPIPLLKQYYHIDLMAIDGLRLGTKRKTSALLPVKVKKEKKPSTIKKIAESKVVKKASAKVEKTKTVKEAKKHFTLDDTAKRLKIDQITDVSKLKTMEKIDQTTAKANELPSQIDEEIKSAKIEEQIDEIKKDIDDILKSSPKKLEEYNAYFKKIKNIDKKIKNTQKNINTLKASLENKYNSLSTDIKDIRKQADMDLKDIKNKVQIAKSQQGRILQDLIGEKYLSYIQKAQKWMGIYKKHKATKKAKKESIAQKYKTGGLDIKFPITAPQPKALIKELRLSGQIDDDLKYVGKIIEISSDQNIRNKPTTLLIKSTKDSKNFQLKGILDFRKDKEIVKFALSSQGNKLNARYWEKDILPFYINNGTYKLDGLAQLQNETIASEVHITTQETTFANQPDYDKKNLVHKITRRILDRNKEYVVDIKYKGTTFAIDSNIDELYAKETQKYFDDQVNKQKKAIEDEWNKKVASKLGGLNSILGKGKKSIKDNPQLAKQTAQIDQYEQQVEDKKKEIKDKQTAAQKKIDAEKKKVENQAKKKVEEEAKKLLKKFKF